MNKIIVNCQTKETTVVPLTDEELTERQGVLANAVNNQLRSLRFERNARLAETDYLALADSTLTDEMRTYRQALRDLPANTTDPANPVWPVKPGGNS
jgi:hypothetical protein